MNRRALGTAAAIAVAALAAAGLIATGDDGGGGGSAAGLSAEESAGVTAVLGAIGSGEPLPYEQDGDTFQNREGLLPDRPEGYYREYTVETPGSDDRGARRLVIGEGGETYYTRDHYGSFIEIDPEDFR
jgi:ribonuclease T1